MLRTVLQARLAALASGAGSARDVAQAYAMLGDAALAPLRARFGL